MKNNLKILSIGLDKSLFDKQSDTYWRVSTYASWVDKYTVIVTTLKSEDKVNCVKGNFKILATNSRNRWGYLLDILRIVGADHDYDLITVQDPFLCGLAGVLIKLIYKIPLNIQIHSEFFTTPYFRSESYFNLFLFFIGLFTVRFADTIRARNHRISEYFRDKKCFYVAAPINQTYLSPVANRKRDKNLVVSVGRDVPQKNFPLLRRAVASAGKNLRLEIITGGKGPEELKKIYDRAKLFVLASNHEGWGLVVLEALARGCPVVMTDTGCAGEIVIDGKTGYVAPVENVTVLADKIKLTLTDYQKSLSMALKGRELVIKDCDLINIQQQTQKMFAATISARRQQNQEGNPGPKN
jgi:glycosyltransferase involved in cell wall biosynthesis